MTCRGAYLKLSNALLPKHVRREAQALSPPSQLLSTAFSLMKKLISMTMSTFVTAGHWTI
jgi:hypothetical protein